MAVTTTVTLSGPYIGTGAVDQQFPVTFHSDSATGIMVLLDDVEVDAADYSFSREADGTGTVTGALDGTVVIISVPDFTQQAEFQRFGPYFPDDLNPPLDRAAIRDLYLLDRSRRSVVVAPGKTGVEVPFDTTDVLLWVDEDGNLTTIPTSEVRTGEQGPPGEPGVDAENIGYFDEAEGIVIDAAISRVGTTTRSALTTVETNRAPGIYIYDAAFDIGTWPEIAFTADDGRIFRLDYHSVAIKPGHFGVRGVSTVSDQVAMQQFCDFVTTLRCAHVRLEGRAYLTETLYFGQAGDSSAADSATLYFGGGKMEIWRLPTAGQFDKLVHMRNCKNCVFTNTFDLRGTLAGGADHDPFTDRDDVGVGLWLEHCRGAIFRQVETYRFWYGGIVTQKSGTLLKDGQVENSNCNYMRIDKIIARYISTGMLNELGGGGTGAEGLIADWTSDAHGTWDGAAWSVGSRNSGTPGDWTERTTIDIDTAKLPPPSIVVTGGDRDDIGTSLSNSPIWLYIDEEPYRLMSLDWGTGVATIAPILPSTKGTSGELKWAWGGAVVFHGADANNIDLGVVDLREVGVGIAIRSGQGPRIASLEIQNDCGPGLVFGDTLTGSNLKGNNTLIQSYYYEGTSNHILWTSDFDNAAISGQIISHSTHEWSQAGVESFKRLSPRNSDDTFVDRSIPRWVIDEDGIRHLKKEHPTTSGTPNHPLASEAGNQFGIIDPEMVKIVRGNTITYQLDNYSLITRLFAYDRQLLVVVGTGTNSEPTGTVTFTVPTGASLNGTTNGTAVFTGFTGPAIFALSETTNDVWVVGLIAGGSRLKGTATYNPPSLAAGAKTAIQTMALTGALLEDNVGMSFSNDLAGVQLRGWVSAADVVSYYFVNENGANPTDLASGTVTARINR